MCADLPRSGRRQTTYGVPKVVDPTDIPRRPGRDFDFDVNAPRQYAPKREDQLKPMRLRLMRTVFALLLTAGSVLLLTGCGASSDPSGHFVAIGGEYSAGSGQPNVKLNVPYIFQSFAVCTDGAPVTITSVVPIPSKDRSLGVPRVIDWGVHLVVPGLHAYPVDDPYAAAGSLAHLSGFSRGPVSAKCPPDPKDPHSSEHAKTWDQFDVNTVSATDVSLADGFAIHYTAGGHSGTAVLPFQLGMCHTQCPSTLLDK
jgi:hypothetical protein